MNWLRKYYRGIAGEFRGIQQNLGELHVNLRE